jgi:hypothetical protein
MNSPEVTEIPKMIRMNEFMGRLIEQYFQTETNTES